MLGTLRSANNAAQEPTMGMTLWIHTLEDRNYSKDSDDHSLMNQHTEALDALCEAAGLRKLSEFVDYTDSEYDFDDADYGDEDDDDFDDDPEIDPETGLAYGIDDMEWFDAAEGLAMLRTLREQLASDGLQGVESDEVEAMLEELDDCIANLEGPAARNGKFHLSLVG
jgi:hypothetical protein